MKTDVKNSVIGFVLASLAALCGCGGGGGAPAAQQTAVIAFSALSTAQLPARISGISIAATLPAGLTVATEPGNDNQVLAGALTSGSVVGDGAETILFGRYSAAARKVRIDLADSSAGQIGFGPGEFARLNCSVTAGVTLTEGDFQPVGGVFPYFKVVGYDSVSHNSIDLTEYLQPRVGVTFE